MPRRRLLFFNNHKHVLVGFLHQILLAGEFLKVVVVGFELFGALNVGGNFLGVILGGLTMCIIYAIAAFFVKQYGTNWISKLFNPLISGTSVLIIGITLTSFIPVYAQVEGQYSLLGVGIAFFVVFFSLYIILSMEKSVNVF